MGKWNDTDVPLAFLITFRTYGTWLHGDARGSVDKAHNKFRTPMAEPKTVREQQQAAKLKSDPFVMDARARKAVDDAIRELFRYRQWHLFSLNVRTNHVHAVASASAGSGRMLGDTKAYATRNLRANSLWHYEHSPWVDKGSVRYLWNEDHIYHACEYVINGQGDKLPMFD